MAAKPPALSTGPEMKVYGLNACAALWHNRAASIIRVYVTRERVDAFGPLLKWCAKHKKAYHIVTPADIERVAQSVHHEGVVILAQALLPLNDESCLERLARHPGPCSLLYLDGVQNPHNVGSITRVAAHFGVPLLLGREGQLPRLTPAAARIAEGGMEHVAFAALRQPAAVFAGLRQLGFKLIGTSSHATSSLYASPLPERCLFILGGEVEGASPQILKGADEVRAIPGSGVIESINVAVAAGLCLGEFWRCHQPPAASPRA